MATIEEADLDDDHWCTSSDVQEDFNIEVQNTDPDFERRIEQATQRVQSWWAEATGLDIPDDLPDAQAGLGLLRDATSLLAASLAHQAFAQNISGTNDGDERHIFLEDTARDTFDDWMKREDLSPGSEASGEESENITGVSGVIGGAENSPILRD